MSYCGFSQVINILYNQIGTVDGLNQTMFLTDFVFKSYDENKTLIKDISGINRWFTGEYSVDGRIREYYANNKKSYILILKIFTMKMPPIFIRLQMKYIK